QKANACWVPCFRGSLAVSPKRPRDPESIVNPRWTACFRRVPREFDCSRQERRKHGTQHRGIIFLKVNSRDAQSSERSASAPLARPLINLPQLPPQQPIIRREEQGVADDREEARRGSGDARIDIPHAHGAAGGAVALPRFSAESAVIGRKDDQIIEDGAD